jgi:hypothetical protein
VRVLHYLNNHGRDAAIAVQTDRWLADVRGNKAGPISAYFTLRLARLFGREVSPEIPLLIDQQTRQLSTLSPLRALFAVRTRRLARLELSPEARETLLAKGRAAARAGIAEAWAAYVIATELGDGPLRESSGQILARFEVDGHFRQSPGAQPDLRSACAGVTLGRDPIALLAPFRSGMATSFLPAESSLSLLDPESISLGLALDHRLNEPETSCFLP